MAAWRVRCLGLGKEHWFTSSDQSGHRICPKCSKEIDRRRISRMCERPIKEPRLGTKGTN